MSRIDIGEVHAFLYQLKSVNETGKKEIQAIKTVVTDYVDDASLKGKAVDASKRYYQATYFSLCDALVEAMDESEERLTQYIRDFQEEVDSSLDTKIDADGLYELGKMIDRIEGKKEALAQQMNSGSEGTMQNYRSQLATAYKEEDILEKYLSFEQGHGNFFDTLTDLVQSVLRMLNELGSNIQFNSQTGTYDMSKLDIQSLERMRQALDKAKGNEATFNFEDYQITLNGTTHLLWKNGKVDAEATKAYNEAKLNGKLPKEENAATQDAELLITILESLKNKKDPITGADISSVQVLSILSGLAFSYRAGRYRGKKLRIPNPDKKKKKNKKSKMKVEISEEVLNHADVGDFTVNPSTGKVSKMKGGGHGQSNIDFLKENGLEVNIEKTYSNGVRTGNVPDHKIKAKRIGNNQSWFPENWTSKDIKSAGQHIASQSNYAIAKDGEVIFGEYNGVRVGVIKTDGEIGTIFPDATKQP
ncbi:T7SS effector LXG polymorphic toxin [Listeria seeligeri]|uniref:T7SS effector LXG polymorphic toxin n=6 Tax=Listeria seeligeri TaxID=1640 RepID=UPI001888D5AE|nr:T7SS effector LXG polymorphic toxin [Listeria seeligeri]MBF2453567.1 EndoU domain-containing protein [Listeria seeligeri]MBF2669254.1 EndoU domain-containing protein [Listeria seeligeri]